VDATRHHSKAMCGVEGKDARPELPGAPIAREREMAVRHQTHARTLDTYGDSTPRSCPTQHARDLGVPLANRGFFHCSTGAVPTECAGTEGQGAIEKYLE